MECGLSECRKAFDLRSKVLSQIWYSLTLKSVSMAPTIVCGLIVLLLLSSASSVKLRVADRFKKTLAPIILSAPLLGVSQPALADMMEAPWLPGLKYEVIEKSSSDVVPKVGENVAIRFKGTYKGTTFDDIMKSDQPYFYRAGVGLILKGLDEAVVHMKVGETWKLNFGGDLSFEKGRPSSPGKPRIPPGAEVDYEVKLVEIPGMAEDFIADYEDTSD